MILHDLGKQLLNQEVSQIFLYDTECVMAESWAGCDWDRAVLQQGVIYSSAPLGSDPS